MVRGKVFRSLSVLADDGHLWLNATVTFASVPISHLTQRIQHMDESGGALMDVLRESTCPFRECNRTIARMLLSNARSLPFRPLFFHYGADAEVVDAIISRLRALLLGMSAQVSQSQCNPVVLSTQ